MLTLYWILVAVMVFGVVGAVFPVLPGVSLIAVAIFIWGLVTSFGNVAIPLTLAAVVLLLSLGIEFLAASWGAKKAGASIWGQVGAIAGLVATVLGLLPTLPIGGPIGPVIGILVGPFLGAIIGEFLYRQDFAIAFKAGVGIVVGSIIGNLIQGLLALTTVVVFLVTTFPR
jgi:uncharacterized protein